MSLTWTPDLLIGNSQIDEQHKMIFEILDHLLGAIAERRGHAQVGRALTSVAIFVVAHFKLEEDLMIQFEYGGLAAHRRSHEAVRLQVEDMVDRFHKDAFAPEILVNFMEWWLRDHVQKQDRPLARFLAALEPAAG